MRCGERRHLHGDNHNCSFHCKPGPTRAKIKVGAGDEAVEVLIDLTSISLLSFTSLNRSKNWRYIDVMPPFHFLIGQYRRAI